ncbi:MAG: UDP-N-acetylglucosamine--N-acetylmuramyl-(pentapeptide) pyrophosphoryl-undecaprenol N-acetylglucosamine transferase [Candidatus Woesebacteria bacterium]|nr:UDP-N-acetylglucosamine--N-acetylmuramyl-(pentapeptide) pyrophosphoryl-undecaprenol N-acetylglucosamine transferase [Candidatus Woesebacteria bacterium]
MQLKKLLLAGSHAGSTAIAVVEEIRKRNLPYEIHWLGMEYKNLVNIGVIFHHLDSGKIENKATKNTVSSFLKIPVSFYKSRKLVKEINPDLVLSFGSAAGALVSFWANMLKIPVIIHEQTATAGRANIFSSYFAKLILISRESSSPFFNKHKIKLVGNPLNNKIISSINKDSRTKVKTILITGGSRGSTWINDAIKPILSTLLEKYYVVHQTGNGKLSDYIKSDKYFAFEQTNPKNMAEILSKSDIVISRAGANTVSELIALKKPSILIPIPWTYNDEQTENAKYMESLGLARILAQKELTAQKLLSEINKLVDNYSAINKNSVDIVSPDLLASEKIVDILEDEI